EVARLIGLLDDWKKRNRFKDRNLAARLHLVAAKFLMSADENQGERAALYLKQGLECEPTDRNLIVLLQGGVAAMAVLGTSSGTGFVVAADANNIHILTNNHVVGTSTGKNKGRLYVRLHGVTNPVPAVLVAADKERDMALIRIRQPAGNR